MWWLLLGPVAHALTLAQWIPNGGGSSAPGVSGGTQVAPDVEHSGVTADDLFSRSGSWSNGGRLPHGYVHTGSSPNLNEYVQFGFSATGAVTFTSVTYDRRSYFGVGAQHASIRWDVDGFGTDLDVQPVNTGDNTADVVFDLSGLAAVLDPDVVFRVYFYDATDDDWADLDDNTGLTIDGDIGPAGFRDADGDGFGDPADVGIGAGFVSDSSDCNDANAAVFPGAPDAPGDGFRNDCSNGGVGDECYQNLDGDPVASNVLFDSPNAGCTGGTESPTSGNDCDDSLATRYPGNLEVCDGIDNNCAGGVDEGALATFFEDGDGDGFGDPSSTTFACTEPPGYASNDTDCDDDDSSAFPGATEVCDGDLEDCDGTLDAGVTTPFYADVDDDGFGDPGSSVQACSAPSGYVAIATDCDDADPSAYPSATEVCDGDLEDCSATIDQGVTTTYYRDADGDDHGDPTIILEACSLPAGYAALPNDCDDGEPMAWSGAEEVCDEVDNDCDGHTDEGVQLTFYVDSDGDGYGDAASEILACTLPDGAAASATDCDDQRGDAYPGAVETCNGADDDCDGFVDNDTNPVQWYVDLDGDGFGDAPGHVSCSAPSGEVLAEGDCNDGDPQVNPGADELCDTFDNDCDGSIDVDAIDASTWFDDLDADGYGDAGATTVACEAPTGTVAWVGDCDDGDPSIHPDAIEVCDGVDNNCEGHVDLDAPNPPSWFPDADLDGFGDEAAVPVVQCAAPSSQYVADDTDCDDTVATTFPGANELCDLIDNDCDTVIDNDVEDRQYYLDGDGDGFGSTTPGSLDCVPQPGEVDNALDCNDADPAVSPAGTEVCDGYDDDCDGHVDTDAIVGLATYYQDFDGDGFGAANTAVLACSPPAGFVTDGTDCNDFEVTVNPVGTEVCDGLDNDCDGLEEDGLPSYTVYPDLDGDGFGDASASSRSDCEIDAGYVEDHSDCDDSSSTTYPGASEVPDNGVDEDCDGHDLGSPPPTPTDPVDTSDTADPIERSAPRVVDAGCQCRSAGSAGSWARWFRR